MSALSTAPAANASVGPNVWSQYRFNDSHDGLSPLQGPAGGDLAWTRDSPVTHKMASSPVQSSSGLIWFSNWDGLAAFRANGTPAGHFVAPPISPDPHRHYVSITGTPAIEADQTVVVGLSDGRLFAFYQNFTLAWRSPFLGTGHPGALGTPTVTPSGRIYVTSAGQQMFAVVGHGLELWNFSTHGAVASAPTVGPDGTVYVGSSNGKLYAVAPNGTEKWAFTTGGAIGTSVAIGPGGLVLFGSQDGRFYALNSNGTLAWKAATSGNSESSAGVSPDGTIYFGSSDGHLYALHSNGSAAWSFATSSPVLSAPAIDARGDVYFGDDAGTVYALNSGGSPVWHVAVKGPIRSSPMVGLGETLYVTNTEGLLFAFVTPVLTSIRFHEVGLPNGTSWSVNLTTRGMTVGATSQLTIVVPLRLPETYTIPTVGCGAGCRYAAVTDSGLVDPISLPTNITVVFVKQYQIQLVLVAGGSATPSTQFWEVANANFAITAPSDSPYGFLDWTSSTPLLTINHPLAALIQVYAGAPGILRAHYT